MFPTTPKVVVGESVPMPTRFSLALTTRLPPSTFRPVFSVVVAVARSGIWKMAVPPSVKTLKILPVKLELFRTSLIKSPEVREEEEAVSQLLVVTVEEAVTVAVGPMEKIVLPASVATSKALAVGAVPERVTLIPTVDSLVVEAWSMAVGEVMPMPRLPRLDPNPAMLTRSTASTANPTPAPPAPRNIPVSEEPVNV